MPGRTPAEAVRSFLTPIQTAVSCVSVAKVSLSRDGWAVLGKIHALTLNDGVQLAPMRSGTHGRLLLGVRQQYEIIEIPEGKRTERDHRYRVSIRSYMYSVEKDSGEAVMDYHWHPQSKNKTTHFHVGTSQMGEKGVVNHKQHWPSSRIAIEAIIRTCITELSVVPLKDDWEQCLALSEGTFKVYRSWCDQLPEVPRTV